MLFQATVYIFRRKDFDMLKITLAQRFRLLKLKLLDFIYTGFRLN